MDRVFKLAREYGAAVICLTIDEEGQARDADWKLRVAKRIYDIAQRALRHRADRPDLRPADVPAVDRRRRPPPRRDGDDRGDPAHQDRAPRRVDDPRPLERVVRPQARGAARAEQRVPARVPRKPGLDAAIVHAARIMPMHKIDDRQREVALDLIYDRRREDYDPLTEFMALFEGVEASARREGGPLRLAGRGAAEAPHHRRRPRRPRGRPRRAARRRRPRSAIINDVLLDGMKVVGELFGTRRDAAAVRAAVGRDDEGRGRATSSRTWRRPTRAARARSCSRPCSGDVHDIGKNLVDIILTNNGYMVYNLGIKIAITEMIDKALEVDADAIGMSGLLVKSTIIMRENLEELNERGLAEKVPVLLGGAALTRNYVEVDLRETLRRPRLLRQGRVRGSAHDGHADGGQEDAARSIPRSVAKPAAASCRPARASVRTRPSRSPTDPTSRPTCPSSRRRSSGHASRRASRSTTSPRTSTRPRCSATSGSSARRRAGTRSTTSSRRASGRSLRAQLDIARKEGAARARRSRGATSR